MNKRAYVICQRLFTFLDEWLFYTVLISLLALHQHADWPLWPFVIAAIWGVFCIGVSYGRQWAMEKDLDDYHLVEETIEHSNYP